MGSIVRPLFDYVGNSVAVVSERVDVPDKAAPIESVAALPAEKKPVKVAPTLRLNKTKMKTDSDSDSAKNQKNDSSPIVKNKEINKSKAEKQEKSPKKPTLNELVDRMDKTRPQLASLRSKIVARIWEPWMRSDLVDRLVAAVYYRWTSISNVFAFCRHAVDERDVYKASNGRRGKAHIWSTLALDVKQLVESVNIKWQETRRGFEVEPQKEPRRVPILA